MCVDAKVAEEMERKRMQKEVKKKSQELEKAANKIKELEKGKKSNGVSQRRNKRKNEVDDASPLLAKKLKTNE